MRKDVRVNRTSWFVAWALLGCTLALGFVSLGVFVLLPAALLAAAMSRSRKGRESAYGAGVALVLGGFVAHRLRRH